MINKNNIHSDNSSRYHQSNEKRAYDHSDKHSARHNENSRLNSERSHSIHDQDDNIKEKGVIVIGRNKSQIKVPMISIKGTALDRNKDVENNDSRIKSNRSSSRRNSNNSSDLERNSQQFMKQYLPNTACSRNNNPERATYTDPDNLPYTDEYHRGKLRQNDMSKNEYNNIKLGTKDLEVIKENHSEFSNSNSVIETFRKQRKSNISSSGNNSGDQHNLHNPHERIKEEDEEDVDNGTTSFRGPKKLNKIYEVPEAETSDIKDSCEPVKLPTQKDSNDSNKFNGNIKVYNFFNKKIVFPVNKKGEQELSPFENPSEYHPIQIHLNEMNSKFLRSQTLSPTNNRLSRSYSSEIPSYIFSQNQKFILENEDESMIYDHKPDSDIYKNQMPIKHFRFSPKSNMNLKELASDHLISNYPFERESGEDAGLMKSPSMGSIKIYEKEKTAEFESEDFHNQATGKQQDMSKEETKLAARSEDVRQGKGLQDSEVIQKMKFPR